MRLASLQTFTCVLGFSAIACSSSEDSPDYSGGNNTGSLGSTGTTGTTAASTSTGFNSGNTTVGSTTVGATTSTVTTGSATTQTPLGSIGASNTTDGSTSSGTSADTSGGFTTGSNTTSANTSGGFTNGGFTSGGFTTGGATTGNPTNGGAGGSTGAGATTSAVSTTGGAVELDCNATMPSGGSDHSGNGQGGQGNLAWQIWSSTGKGELTTFDGVPAFRASWNEAGDYLGRIGFEWGNNGAPYTAHGTISAQFVAKKTVGTGNGGGLYSYIGMYGWTTNPCVEWYVIDDSFKQMPVNPGNTVNKGEVDIDGGTYIMYTRDTSGTGGSRCSGVNNWVQYYSVRKTARDCGVISLTEHFEAWDSLGMSMAGNLLEAKILVEVGGESGAVDFPIANVTTTQ